MIQVSKSLFVLSALPALLLSACVAHSDRAVTITKVNPYHLRPGMSVTSRDHMIVHEHRRLLHGAIDTEEKVERYGNYFTVFWKAKDRSPATVRLQYRQAGTGSTLHVKEVAVDRPGRSNTTKFEVVSDEYQSGGKVIQWRASVLQGGVEVAEFRSYLWD